jgi:hypothetical protein
MIAALKRVAVEATLDQRIQPMRAQSGQGDRLARSGAIHYDGLIENFPLRQLSSDLVAISRNPPLLKRVGLRKVKGVRITGHVQCAFKSPPGISRHNID